MRWRQSWKKNARDIRHCEPDGQTLHPVYAFFLSLIDPQDIFPGHVWAQPADMGNPVCCGLGNAFHVAIMPR